MSRTPRSVRSTSGSAFGRVEPPSSTNEVSREERKPVQEGLIHPKSYDNLLLPWHKPKTVGAMSKLAPVVREYRTLYSGTTTANVTPLASPSPFWGRAREHRELNQRDNPRRRSEWDVSKTHPCRWQDGKRKPGRVHAWGRGAHCRCGKAPPSRSDRPPQGARERVGRGSLLDAISSWV